MKATTVLASLLITSTLWSAPKDSIPVELKELDCVIYIDGTQAAGSQPAGLSMLLNLTDAYQTHGIQGTITAVFDDAATTIILNDEAYNAQTETSSGNPYAETVAGLVEQGVVIAVCSNDLEGKSLTEDNLLSGVKTTSRGILLVAQLAREGAFTVPTPLPGDQAKD